MSWLTRSLSEFPFVTEFVRWFMRYIVQLYGKEMADIEFEASLVYRVSSRIARAT